MSGMTILMICILVGITAGVIWITAYCFYAERQTPADKTDEWEDITDVAYKAAEDVVLNVYDKEDIYENCTVQVLTNTVTGEVSFGFWPNSNPPIELKQQ